MKRTTEFMHTLILIFLALIPAVSCKNELWPVKDEESSLARNTVSTANRTITIPGADSTASFVMIDVHLTGAGNTDEIILGEDLIEVPYRTTVKQFSLARYETSYNTWYAVLQWAKTNGYTIVNEGVEGVYGGVEDSVPMNPAGAGAEPKLVEMPVCSLSWRDAMVWCNALSEICGLTPVYYTDSNFKTPIRNSTGPSSNKLEDYLIQPGQIDNPYVNKDADGFRLAYREEWEYAARKKKDGGFISGRNVSGDDSGAMFSPTAIETMNGISFPVSKVYQNYMWWRKNSLYDGSKTATGYDDSTATLRSKTENNSIGSYRTHLSGGKLPNHLGFYDLSGNVPEWCFDYNTTYGSTNNFHTMRSFKGGDQVNESHTGNPSHCSGNPGGQLVGIKGGGFRIAQNIPKNNSSSELGKN